MEKDTGYLVYDLLPTGKENAISTKELMHLTGCNSPRLLCKLIERERENVVICSSTSGGYYKPANKAELREFERTLNGRAMGILHSLKSARRALREFDGQQKLEAN